MQTEYKQMNRHRELEWGGWGEQKESTTIRIRIRTQTKFVQGLILLIKNCDFMV